MDFPILNLKKNFQYARSPCFSFWAKDEKRPVAQKIASGTTFTAKAKGRGLEEKRGLAHFRWTNLQ